MGFLLANLLKVPLPDLRGNRLTNGTQDTEVLHLVVDVVVTSTLQQTQSGGGNVELSDLVLVDDVPVAREVGVGGSTLEDNGSATHEQGSVDDVGVTRDPANVTTAEKAVVVVDVKDILASQGGTEQVTSRRVHDTLGLTSRTGGVQQEQGVFGADGLGGEVVGVLLNLLVPPEVTAGGPRDVSASAFVDQHAGNVGALLESLIDDALGANDLATTAALIGGDDDLGLSVDHTVPQRVRGETSEDDGVNSANTRASQEGNEGLGNHGKVDGNGITLLDTLLLEGPGDAGDLTEELAVGDGAALIGLVGLVDDGNLVGVLDGVTVDAVVGSVQTTLNEPGDITVDEGAGAGGLEVLFKGEVITGHASPEGVGVADGLFIELFVLVKVFEVGAGRMLVVEGFGDVDELGGLGLVGLQD